MTLLALVEPGDRRKLCLVFVVMTVHAAGELNFVERAFALGNVTLRALQFRVLALQRILRGSMRLQVELRRLPSVDVMTRRALAQVGTLRKLAVVCILVTVGAL